MAARTSFPPVFWIANSIEVLERFSYYGIYMGFGIYMEYLGYTKAELGVVQGVFLLFSYFIPVISGTFADRFGFKKVLIVSYLAYLPSVLLLLITRTYSGLALTMLSIGLAAGIFKPLISGTVRTVSDKTNKTLGFGIFYAMVNIGATFGPIIMGRLRAVSWNHAFVAAAIGIAGMLLITIFFYKEPPRELQSVTLKEKFKDIYVALADYRFLVFLGILGVFFWIPFWAFFNLLALYVDRNLDTARLYLDIRAVFSVFGAGVGAAVADFISHVDETGVRRILGETISHDGYVIMIFQIPISHAIAKLKALPTFMLGLFMSGVGFVVLGLALLGPPSLVFAGIALFAIGEMLASPRIQEYITWIAPKEKAGLYMGTNFLATAVGAFLSGPTYTTLYGHVRDLGHPDYVWYALGAHMVAGVLAMWLFTRTLGEFKELEA
jgi:dipeptide/tripeptide permease